MATLTRVVLELSRISLSVSWMTIATLLAHAQAKSDRHEVLLLRGQVLELALVTPLDSAHNNVGDKVVLRLARPLQAGGVTVLPANSTIEGRVTKVVRAGKNCRPGQLEWKLLAIKLPDRTRIKVLVKPYENSLDEVRFGSRWTTVGRALTYAVMVITTAPVVAVQVPITLALAIATSTKRNCDAYGDDAEIPADTAFYTVVSKAARIREPNL